MEWLRVLLLLPGLEASPWQVYPLPTSFLSGFPDNSQYPFKLLCKERHCGRNSFALKHNTMTRQCLETRTLYQEVSASTIRLYVSHNSLSTEEKCLDRWTVHPVTCHCLITVVEIWLKHKRCGMTFWSHTPGTYLHWKCFPTTAYLLDLRIC